jgi:hypothetical protein
VQLGLGLPLAFIIYNLPSGVLNTEMDQQIVAKETSNPQIAG